MSSFEINIINDDEFPILSENELLECLEIVATNQNLAQANVNINIVSNSDIQEVNSQYRQKDKPTNIISFPFEKPEGLPEDIMNEFLGDILIAPDVLKKEAIEQNKPLENHWKHIFIHGLLHLCGYDHIIDAEAEEMENLEIQLLEKLNIANPYL